MQTRLSFVCFSRSTWNAYCRSCPSCAALPCICSKDKSSHGKSNSGKEGKDGSGDGGGSRLPETLLEVACLGLEAAAPCSERGSGYAGGVGKPPAWLETYPQTPGQETSCWDAVRELELRRQCASAVASLCSNSDFTKRLAASLASPDKSNIMRVSLAPPASCASE